MKLLLFYSVHQECPSFLYYLLVPLIHRDLRQCYPASLTAHITQFIRDWFPSCCLRLCRLFLRSAVVLLSSSAVTGLKTRQYRLPHSMSHDPCYPVPFPCLARVFLNSDISGEEHSLILLFISVAPTSTSSAGLPLLYQSLNLRAIFYHISLVHSLPQCLTLPPALQV